MLTAAKTCQHIAPLPPASQCIGAADWLSTGENPLLRHHRIALARDMVLAVVDRVLTAVKEEYFDDVEKVKTVENYDRVDNYIAALRVLAN